MGAVPMASSRSGSSRAPSGSRAWVSRWGTARTTVSASSRSPVPGPASVVTCQPPSGRRVMPVARVRRAVRTPARSRAARARVWCSSPRGTRAQPMSAAPGAESSPVLKTMAARPSEAWSAVALRVAMPTRSHSASTVRADWPRRRSQVPKSTPSRAGSSGSRPPRARAARPTLARSASERCGYVARLAARCSGTGRAARRSLPRRGRPEGWPTSRTGTSSRSCSGARCRPSTRSRNHW